MWSIQVYNCEIDEFEDKLELAGEEKEVGSSYYRASEVE